MPKAAAVKRVVKRAAASAATTKAAIKEVEDVDYDDQGDYDSGVLVVDPGNIGDDCNNDTDEEDEGTLFMEVEEEEETGPDSNIVDNNDNDDDDEDDEDDEGLVIDDEYDSIEEFNGGSAETESYDPLSLVSVGLLDDEDEEYDDDIAAQTDLTATCTFCQKSFTERKHLTRHIKSVHQKACSVACQYCGRVLSDQDSYKRHINTVHKVKVSAADPAAVAASFPPPVLSVTALAKPCPDCSQKFATKTTLNLHRLKAHVVALKQLPCPQCGQECPDLTAHMRRLHDVQGIVCPHCANIFSKKCTLNRHIEQVHLNIQIHKPATCCQCGKVFSKKGHLDRHVKIIHKGIKDYSDPCPYCNKVFTTRASLEPHIAMVHEGIRKMCPICKKVLSDLNKHMRTVHHTYRRKAKIPKDMISELDNPDLGIEPQIYGAKSFKSHQQQQQEVAAVAPVAAVKDQPAMESPPAATVTANRPSLMPPMLAAVVTPKFPKAIPPLLPVAGAAVTAPPLTLLRTKTTAAAAAVPTKKSLLTTAAAVAAVPAKGKMRINLAADESSRGDGGGKASALDTNSGGDVNLETIKQELGLSDTITLQKISKPRVMPTLAAPPSLLPPPPLSSLPPPPRLTYHGPAPLAPAATNRTQTFGSITLTPIAPPVNTMSALSSAAAVGFSLLNRLPTQTAPERPVMVKITGKPKGLNTTRQPWQSFKALKRETSS